MIAGVSLLVTYLIAAVLIGYRDLRRLSREHAVPVSKILRTYWEHM